MKLLRYSLLLVFLSLMFVSKAQEITPDAELLHYVNQTNSPFMRDYSRLISNSTTLVSASVPVAVGLVGWVQHDEEKLKDALCIGASMALDGVLTYSMKRIIKRPRPGVSYPGYIEPFEDVSSLSFPSGHTSLAFVTATSLSLQYPEWYIVVPSYLWACSVGYSRMNLGVHYPSDVLAGALLGAGSAYVTYKLNQWYWNKHPDKKLVPATWW